MFTLRISYKIHPIFMLSLTQLSNGALLHRLINSNKVQLTAMYSLAYIKEHCTAKFLSSSVVTYDSSFRWYVEMSTWWPLENDFFPLITLHPKAPMICFSVFSGLSAVLNSMYYHFKHQAKLNTKWGTCLFLLFYAKAIHFFE